MSLQAAGVALAAAGTLSKVLGKDTDYPAIWGAIRIDNGVAKVVGQQYALDTGDTADALRMATAYADYMNASMDAMGLSPEQRATISSPGITVGLVAGDRPGAVSEGGFFFGQMNGGDGWMSGITANNQGFSTPEQAMNGLMAYTFNEALKPDLANTDWNEYLRSNVDSDGYSLEDAYLDYKYDQQEEGRGYASMSTWARQHYDKEASAGNWPKMAHPTMDAETAGKLAYTAANPPKFMDLGLDLTVPEKFQDKNFWTRVGGVAQKVGAAMAAAGYGGQIAAAEGATTSGSAWGISTTSNPYAISFSGAIEGGGGTLVAEGANVGLQKVATEAFKQWLADEVRDISSGDKAIEASVTDDDQALQQILWNIDEILLTENAYEYQEPVELQSEDALSGADNTSAGTTVQATTPTESSVEQVESGGQTASAGDGTAPSPTGQEGVTYGQEVPEEFKEDVLTSDDVLSNTAGDEIIPEDDVVAEETPQEGGGDDSNAEVLAGIALIDQVLNSPDSDNPEAADIPRTADGTPIGDASAGVQVGPAVEDAPDTVQDVIQGDITIDYDAAIADAQSLDPVTGEVGETTGGAGVGEGSGVTGDGTGQTGDATGSQTDLPDIDIDIPSPSSGPQFSDFGIPIYAPLALEKYRRQKSLEMPEFLT